MQCFCSNDRHPPIRQSSAPCSGSFSPTLPVALRFHPRARNSERNHQQRTLSGGVRLEKFSRVVVVEGESRRAAAERICRKVGATAKNSSLEMCVAVAAISQRVQRALEVGHVNNQCGTIHTELLFEAQIS